MKSLKVAILILVLTVLGACGEGFRGSATGQSFELNETNQENWNNDGTRRSFTQTDVDRDIMIGYSNQLNGREGATRAVTQQIQAFDLMLAATENDGFVMRTRIVENCNQAYVWDSSIDQARLADGQTLSLGQEGPYRVEVQCTHSGCTELVAAIHKISGTNQGTVLAGLAVGGQGQGQVLYVSRTVQYTPYYASFLDVQRFENNNSCSVGNPQEDQSIVDLFTDRAVELGEDLLKDWLDDAIDDLF